MARVIWYGFGAMIGVMLSWVVHLLLGLVLLSAVGLIIIGNYVMAGFFIVVGLIGYDCIVKRLRGNCAE